MPGTFYSRSDQRLVFDAVGLVGVGAEAGAAVLLVSEDLDELFELADRVLVMFEGSVVYETSIAMADRTTIGRHMAGY